MGIKIGSIFGQKNKKSKRETGKIKKPRIRLTGPKKTIALEHPIKHNHQGTSSQLESRTPTHRTDNITAPTPPKKSLRDNIQAAYKQFVSPQKPKQTTKPKALPVATAIIDPYPKEAHQMAVAEIELSPQASYRAEPKSAPPTYSDMSTTPSKSPSRSETQSQNEYTLEELVENTERLEAHLNKLEDVMDNLLVKAKELPPTAQSKKAQENYNILQQRYKKNVKSYKQASIQQSIKFAKKQGLTLSKEDADKSFEKNIGKYMTHLPGSSKPKAPPPTYDEAMAMTTSKHPAQPTINPLEVQDQSKYADMTLEDLATLTEKLDAELDNLAETMDELLKTTKDPSSPTSQMDEAKKLYTDLQKTYIQKATNYKNASIQHNKSG